MGRLSKKEKMALAELSASYESKDRDWLIKRIYDYQQALASVNRQCMTLRENLSLLTHEKSAEEKELEVLKEKADNFNFILRKLGFNPRKLRIYYKEKGCRDYVRDNADCDYANHYCDSCNLQYEQDCIGVFVLYDFCLINGTTYEDYDGFNHSILHGINASLFDIDLEDVEKIEDLETDKVIYEANN